MKMERCPNPECEGGEDSLEIVEDELCVKDRCCWVRCDWCGVAGPVAGTSRESAIEAWNILPRINSGGEEKTFADAIEAAKLARHAGEIKSTNVDLKSEVERLKGELCKAIRRGDWLAELIVDLSGEVILRFPYEETGDPPAH